MICRPESRTALPVGAALLRLCPVAGQISHVYLKTHTTAPFLASSHKRACGVHVPAVPCYVLGPSPTPQPQLVGPCRRQKVSYRTPGLEHYQALGGRGKPYGFKSMCLKGGCCLSLNFLLVGFLATECINIVNEQT